MSRGMLTVIAVAAMMVGSSAASALPRFASRTGAKCQSCHINPGGGAMRQVFGAQYGRDKLPVPEWSDDLQIEDFTTLVANVLGVGADFRTLFFARQGSGVQGSPDSASRNAFWQMQGDLYLHFRLAKKVSLFLKKGLYSGFEAYGLFQVLPAHGHIKVGKFIPEYGLRIDDHTAYIRTETGFDPSRGRPELTGAEVGLSPGPWSFVGGFYNAADGFGASTGNQKAFLGRAEGLFGLAQDLHFGIGGNVFLTKTTGGDTRTLLGGFGSLSIGDFTLLGEADAFRTKSAGRTITGIATLLEGDYLLRPGVDLKLSYEFFDPDKDTKTGAVSRISFGVEFFPLPGVEVRPVYRIVRDDPVETPNNEGDVMIHFYL